MAGIKPGLEWLKGSVSFTYWLFDLNILCSAVQRQHEKNTSVQIVIVKYHVVPWQVDLAVWETPSDNVAKVQLIYFEVPKIKNQI